MPEPLFIKMGKLLRLQILCSLTANWENTQLNFSPYVKSKEINPLQPNLLAEKTMFY